MKKMFLAALFAIVMGTVGAQKITILDGSLDALKGQSIVNVEYDWSKIAVGKYIDEADYLEKKSSEYNKKEPGRGEKWISAWHGDKTRRFVPEFEKLFNKHLKKTGIYVGNEKSARYKMVVTTTYIEPGYNVYVSKMPAFVTLTIDIQDTESGKSVCEIVSKGNPGRTYGLSDMDTGVRIAEAYALAGKKLAGFFVKKLK